jgi:hypothetical protein
MNNIHELGKTRANRYANKNNILKLSSCNDCDSKKVCQHKIEQTVSDTRFVTQVKFGGEIFKVTDLIVDYSQIAVSDTVNMNKFLYEVFSKIEYNIWFKYEYYDGVIRLEHIGYTDFQELHLDDLTVIETTTCCNIQTTYNYSFVVNGAMPTITYNGQDYTMPNSPYDFNDDELQDTATAEQLKTDLDELNIPNTTWNVGVHDNANVFIVNIESIGMADISIEDNPVKNCGNTKKLAC